MELQNKITRTKTHARGFSSFNSHIKSNEKAPFSFPQHVTSACTCKKCCHLKLIDNKRLHVSHTHTHIICNLWIDLLIRWCIDWLNELMIDTFIDKMSNHVLQMFLFCFVLKGCTNTHNAMPLCGSIRYGNVSSVCMWIKAKFQTAKFRRHQID